jgi:hypothetical protein
MDLGGVRYDDGRFRAATHRHHEPESALAGYLDDARALLASLPAPPHPEDLTGRVGPDFDALRWFWLPGEIAQVSGR